MKKITGVILQMLIIGFTYGQCTEITRTIELDTVFKPIWKAWQKPEEGKVYKITLSANCSTVQTDSFYETFSTPVTSIYSDGQIAENMRSKNYMSIIVTPLNNPKFSYSYHIILRDEIEDFTIIGYSLISYIPDSIKALNLEVISVDMLEADTVFITGDSRIR